MLRQNLNTVIQLTNEQKIHLLDEIKTFYLDVRGDEICIIEQHQVFDLFMEQLAPVIYNKALDDAQRWYKTQQDNLESDYYLLYRDIR